MSLLQLNLLGPFSATLDERPLTDFRTNKVQALLIYLVVEAPTIHQREALMTLLWPGLPLKSAQTNLRQIVYQLKKLIPDVPLAESDTSRPFVISQRKTLQLNPDYSVENDTAQFNRLLQQIHQHNHNNLLSCEPCQQMLQGAIDLYHGEFLAGFSLYDSATYESWAQRKREAFRRQILDALDNLTKIYLSQEEFSQAEKLAQQQLAIDNLREIAYRQLMRIMALTGQRSEAIALYEQCSVLLEAELGMAPVAKTSALYEQIKNDNLSPSSAVQPGIRGYELGEKLGEGAFGTVHKALQKGIGREVAVKIIQPQYANQPQFIRRFEAEAQIVARLEHPHIVPLYDYWREPDGAYLVMRWLRGGSLQAALEKELLTVETAVSLITQIAMALHTAHRQGIIHRDVKPANILLDEEGNAYLSDFGIARDTTANLHLTASHQMLGSPAYISPEQLLGEEVTPATDIYCLGLVLYTILTGTRPFSTTSMVELIQKQINEPLPMIGSQQSDFPAIIDNIIQQATAKKAQDRFSDTLEMANALQQVVRQTDSASLSLLPQIEAITELDIINPYKGLHAFQERDADHFYGRSTLIKQLLSHFSPSPSQGEGWGEGQNRFLAIVGPSGSGKSSVVKAGLIPALRNGAVPGSANWFMAEMTPGSYPLEELEAALLHVAIDPPPNLLDPLQKDERGLLRILKRLLPQDRDEENSSQLLLVIDQFEELFTLVENKAERARFLDNLFTALTDAHSRLWVIVTLRADFYDRPLQLPQLGEWLRQRTELVLPLTTAELEQTITAPAANMGVALESGLVAAIMVDVKEQPGALPLLQYALTELFERRDGRQMTMAAYEEIGGITGALARRADEIYDGLDSKEQEVTRQLFMRLVTLGEGVEDTRRRVLQSELTQLDNNEQGTGNREPLTDDLHPSSLILHNLEIYGRYRLLTFDHDPITREPTVEIAHEALIREWTRLQDWLREGRTDIRLQRLLATATMEWAVASQDDGYLLRGSRLDLFQNWVNETHVALTQDETMFLEVSFAARDQRTLEEETRRQRELETAQQLAQTERQRAEEHAHSAQNLRRRAIYLSIALIAAAILAIFAIIVSRQSNFNAKDAQANAYEAATQAAVAQQNEQLAIQNAATAEAESVRAEAEAVARTTQEAIAVIARDEAEEESAARATAQTEAEEQTQLTKSRELAIQSSNQIDHDPDLSLLLAMQAVNEAETSQALSALHMAILNHRLLRTIRQNEIDTEMWVVEFSPNGQQIATGGVDGLIQIIDFATEEIIRSWQAHDNDISTITFSPDGTMLATNDIKGEAIIWNIETGQALFSVDSGLDYDIWPTAFGPNGIRFTSPAPGGVAKVWDIESGEELLTLVDEEGDIKGVTLNPAGTLLATIGESNQLKVWDANSGEILLNLVNDSSWPDLLDFSPDGTYLIANGDDLTTVRVWNIPDLIEEYPNSADAPLIRTELYSLTGHKGNVIGATFSTDERFLITGGQGGVIKMWALATGEEILSLSSHAGAVNNLTISPECYETHQFPFNWCGRYLVSAHGNGILQVWDISPIGNQEIATIPGAYAVIDKDSSQIMTYDCCQCDSTGCQFISGNLWSLPESNNEEDFSNQVPLQSTLLSTFDMPQHDVGANGFQPFDWNEDRSKLSLIYSDKTLFIYEASTGEHLSEFPITSHPGVVQVAAFSQDDNFIATGDDTGIVKVWHVNTGDEIATLDNHLASIEALDFNNSGDRLITASRDGTAKIWNLDTKEELHNLDTHTNWVRSVDFAPDGSMVATGSRDTKIRLWDVQSGDELFTLSGHSGSVMNLDFSPDGTMLASGSFGDNVNVWDTATGRQLLRLTGPEGRGLQLREFSPDGTMILVKSADNVSNYLHTLILPHRELLALAKVKLTRWFTSEECQQFLHQNLCPDPP